VFGTVFEFEESKNNNMKHLLTIFGFLAIAFAGFSQGPDYTDLRILYADQDYEKLAKEAEKYTTNDKTKKDVLPYFGWQRDCIRFRFLDRMMTVSKMPTKTP